MASLSLYIVTFNCARLPVDKELFSSHLFNGHDGPALPDVLVLALQELAPVPQSFIGGRFVEPYFESFQEAVRMAVQKYHGDVHQGYKVISREAIGMTGIMVFSQDSSAIEDVETAGVGVGLWQMGNKGAVSVRFSFADKDSDARTEFTFVSAHLAATEGAVSRRNEDWKHIVRGLVFSSTKRMAGNALSLSGDDERPLLSVSPANASLYKPTSHLFLAGDLNYRTSIMKPAPDNHRTAFPQPWHPPSSPQHYSKLLANDQLNQERLAGRVCHGLVEPHVTFPPTYKFERESPESFSVTGEETSRWTWAKHRWPSWCDRILYLDHPKARVVVHKYSALPLIPTSDHRPVALSLSVPLKPNEDGDDNLGIQSPFNIDPDWRSKRARARTLELVSGLALFLISTREGLVILTASVIGITGSYLVLKSLQ